MIPWGKLTDALDELDTIRAQVREGRAQERTTRFYSLRRTRQVGTEHAGQVGAVIELSGGWVIVHWLHDERSIGLYSSILSATRALTMDGVHLLSLEDSSERRNPNSRANQTRSPLTPQERAILLKLGHGLSNQEIGLQLHLAESTISNTLSDIYRKLEVSSRIECALLARDLNLLEAESGDLDT